MMLETDTINKEKLQRYQAETTAEFERILEFWRRHALDHKNGGFIGRMDNAGVVDENSSKGGVLNARILWSFSAGYRFSGKDEYLACAERAFHYLLEHFVDQEFGGVYWAVDAQGTPLSTRKQIYALAFAIYGLAEYYQATGAEKALQVSQDLFHWIEKYSYDPEQGGYFEAFSREGGLLEDLRLSEKDRNDPKTMNTHLHILEAYANLYRIWPARELAEKLEALINVFLQHIVDANTGHMKLFLSKDWKSSADLVSYGHDIEASWLLFEAAEVLGKVVVIEEVKAVALQMVEVTLASLQPDGSLFHELNKDENHYDKHREWWVSAEAMVGFLNAYQLTQKDAFLESSLRSWEFVKEHFMDREHGEWFWGVYDDYSLMQKEDKIGFWKCPYHNTRACLEVAHRSKLLAE